MEDLLRCIVLVKHLECNFGISRYEPRLIFEMVELNWFLYPVLLNL